MMNNNKKGFTLIELLVVIAIIGIISAMVMLIVNPEEQTNKAKDAKVKSSLDSVRVKVGEIFAETTPFGYLNAHNNPTVLKILDSVDNGSIESNEDAWAAKAQFTDGTYYCKDSRGNATTQTTQDITDFLCD